MKLSFSTLGCLDFDWTDIYAMAKDFGFDGIEMRGLGNDIFSVRAQPFRADQIDNTIASGSREGMISMDQAIAKIYQEGMISLDTALHYADKPDQLKRQLA